MAESWAAEAAWLVLALALVLALPLALHAAGPAGWPLVAETAGGLVLTLAAHLGFDAAGRHVFGLGGLAALGASLALGLGAGTWGAGTWTLVPLAGLAALPAAAVLALLGRLNDRWRFAALSLALGEAVLLPLAFAANAPPVPAAGGLVVLLVGLGVAAALVVGVGRSPLAAALRAAHTHPRLGAVLGVRRPAGRALVLLVAGLLAGLGGGMIALGTGGLYTAWSTLSLVAPAAVVIGGGSRPLACLTLLPLLVLPRIAADLAPELPNFALPMAAVGLGLNLLLRQDAPRPR